MKVLHIDDHTLFRAGMRHIIQQLQAQTEFLEAPSIKTALANIPVHQDIDLLLLDLAPFDENHLNGFNTLRERLPNTAIVVVSASEQPEHINTALAAGAGGYIPKSATGITLIRALNLVLAGGIYAPRSKGRHTASNTKPASNQAMTKLTQRQAEVFALMAQGLSNKAIARKLFISEATVKGHVTAILTTLGVANRVQAINCINNPVDDWKLAS